MNGTFFRRSSIRLVGTMTVRMYSLSPSRSSSLRYTSAGMFDTYLCDCVFGTRFGCVSCSFSYSMAVPPIYLLGLHGEAVQDIVVTEYRHWS